MEMSPISKEVSPAEVIEEYGCLPLGIRVVAAVESSKGSIVRVIIIIIEIHHGAADVVQGFYHSGLWEKFLDFFAKACVSAVLRIKGNMAVFIVEWIRSVNQNFSIEVIFSCQFQCFDSMNSLRAVEDAFPEFGSIFKCSVIGMAAMFFSLFLRFFARCTSGTHHDFMAEVD